MTALIIGGDYIRPLEKVISDRGLDTIEHWTGRKSGDLKRTVPKDTRLVVLLLDYLSHSMARKIKGDADRLGVPVIYCRRSLGQLCAKLDELLGAGVPGVACGATPGSCEVCPRNGTSRLRN